MMTAVVLLLPDQRDCPGYRNPSRTRSPVRGTAGQRGRSLGCRPDRTVNRIIGGRDRFGPCFDRASSIQRRVTLGPGTRAVSGALTARRALAHAEDPPPVVGLGDGADLASMPRLLGAAGTMAARRVSDTACRSMAKIRMLSHTDSLADTRAVLRAGSFRHGQESLRFDRRRDFRPSDARPKTVDPGWPDGLNEAQQQKTRSPGRHQFIAVCGRCPTVRWLMRFPIRHVR